MLALTLSACGGQTAATVPSSIGAAGSTAPSGSLASASASAAAGTGSASSSAAANSAASVSASIYFEANGKLVAEQARVDGSDPIRQALQALMRGPAEPGHYTDIPQGTKLLDVSAANGAATVSLSPEFFASGGSTAAEMRTGQVVYTATGFSTVQTVRILESGQPATLGEGLNVAQPLTRQSLRGVSGA